MFLKFVTNIYNNKGFAGFDDKFRLLQLSAIL